MSNCVKWVLLVVSFILASIATISGIAGVALVIWTSFDIAKTMLLAYCAICYFGSILILAILYLIVSLYEFIKNKRHVYG